MCATLTSCTTTLFYTKTNAIKQQSRGRNVKLGDRRPRFYSSLLQTSLVNLTFLVQVSVAQSCPTMDYSPPGSSVHGISQARILRWVAISSSRGSSQPRDPNRVSWTSGRFFTVWATREALTSFNIFKYKSRKTDDGLRSKCVWQQQTLSY